MCPNPNTPPSSRLSDFPDRTSSMSPVVRRVWFNDDATETRVVRKIANDKNREILWYSEDDLNYFRDKSEEGEPRFGVRDARTFNFVRRILHHHKTCKEIGTDDKRGLRKLSRTGSRLDCQQAHEIAIVVAEEVRQDNVSFERALTRDGVMRSGRGLDPSIPRMDDYVSYIHVQMSDIFTCVPREWIPYGQCSA